MFVRYKIKRFIRFYYFYNFLLFIILSFKIRLPHISRYSETVGIPVFQRKTTAAQGVNSLVKKYMYLKYIYFMRSMLLIHLHMYVLNKNIMQF